MRPVFRPDSALGAFAPVGQSRQPTFCTSNDSDLDSALRRREPNLERQLRVDQRPTPVVDLDGRKQSASLAGAEADLLGRRDRPQADVRNWRLSGHAIQWTSCGTLRLHMTAANDRVPASKEKNMPVYRMAVVAVSLCCAALSAAPAGAQGPQVDRPIKILLIGNSLTYTNSLASPLTSFAGAASQPRAWQVSEQAMANARLSQMWGLRTTEYLLKDEAWDYIVLQEHGDVPTSYPEGLFSAARNFDAAAKKIGAKIVLFENWRRRASSQPEVTEVFAKLARELGAKVAPVGRAWVIVGELDPHIQLREGDGIHPSAFGTYVAACVIYMTIADASECPAVLYGSIDERLSQIAREASRRAVVNSRKSFQSR